VHLVVLAVDRERQERVAALSARGQFGDEPFQRVAGIRRLADRDELLCELEAPAMVRLASFG
jgi:hypothetical protein